MNILLFIGAAGCASGVAVGLAGTYLAVAESRGPQERSFMRRAAVVCWVAVAAYFGALFLLEEAWPLVWAGCLVALPLGLRQWSRRQREIRRWEQAQVAVMRARPAVDVEPKVE